MLNWQQIIEKNSAFINFNVKETDFLSENDEFLQSKTGIIYVIVNFVNGKVYVGQSLNSFKVRYNKGWWITSDNEHLLSAAKKYNKTNFSILLLEEGRGRNILNILETYYILKFQSYKNEFGYNKTLGGNSYKLSPETREKRDRLRTIEIIAKSKEIYGENAFQYLETRIMGKSQIKIVCNTCSCTFWKSVSHHIGKQKQGCPKCSIKQRSLSRTHGFDDFLRRAVQKHGNNYEYTQDKFVNLFTKIPIKHKICGQASQTIPIKHLTSGCKICWSKELSSKMCRSATISKDNKTINFKSIKDAQIFINSEMGTNHVSELRRQAKLNGNKFHYKGFNITIST